jgi:hypothetical protein
MIQLVLSGARLVATPGFLAAHPREVLDPWMTKALKSIGRDRDSEPSMVFGRPEVTEDTPCDEFDKGDGTKVYCSIRINAPSELWLKRDDHPDGPIFTFLLPRDY